LAAVLVQLLGAFQSSLRCQTDCKRECAARAAREPCGPGRAVRRPGDVPRRPRACAAESREGARRSRFVRDANENHPADTHGRAAGANTTVRFERRSARRFDLCESADGRGGLWRDVAPGWAERRDGCARAARVAAAARVAGGRDRDAAAGDLHSGHTGQADAVATRSRDCGSPVRDPPGRRSPHGSCAATSAAAPGAARRTCPVPNEHPAAGRRSVATDERRAARGTAGRGSVAGCAQPACAASESGSRPRSRAIRTGAAVRTRSATLRRQLADYLATSASLRPPSTSFTRSPSCTAGSLE